MLGNLEPEERVMTDTVWEEDGIVDRVNEIIETLGWKETDEIEVVVGGTVVSGIHQVEGYNKKWSLDYGERKYNPDAFIVIRRKEQVVSSEAPKDK
jgi:hypothetical protein